MDIKDKIFKKIFAKPLEEVSLGAFPEVNREIHEKLQNRSRPVKILSGKSATYFAVYGNHSLGWLFGLNLGMAMGPYSDDLFKSMDVFHQFIKKFAEMTKSDRILTARWYRIYGNVDYQLLLAGYSLIKRDRKNFEELFEKANNADEFLAASGIIA